MTKKQADSLVKWIEECWHVKFESEDVEFEDGVLSIWASCGRNAEMSAMYGLPEKRLELAIDDRNAVVNLNLVCDGSDETIEVCDEPLSGLNVAVSVFVHMASPTENGGLTDLPPKP